MDEAAGCCCPLDFFIFLLDSLLVFRVSGGCVSLPRCEIKKLSSRVKSLCSRVFFLKHTVIHDLPLFCQSVLGVGAEEPGLWLGVKAPRTAREDLGSRGAAAWVSSCCRRLLGPARVPGADVMTAVCSQQLFWAGKPFPWGLSSGCATPWTWPAKLFSCSASGLV